MMRKFTSLLMVVLIIAAYSAIKVEKQTAIAKIKNDPGMTLKGDVLWTRTMGPTFDKSANGYGWYQAYNRKVQTNFDPTTGHMVGSIYRQLAASGSGTIGGMTGSWAGATFSGTAESIYTSSPYQGGAVGDPGGRYPHTVDFINGYLFGLFNDFDLTTGGEVSQAMFTVCDATFGWDFPLWSESKRVEAVEGGATPPGAWTLIGDVVYNPADGYYYMAFNASNGLAYDSPYSLVTGRSNDPTNPASWEWTDFNDYAFDTTVPTGITDMVGKWQFSYAKDIYGNGTGYGIGVAMIVDETYEMTNLAGEPLVVENQPRLGYVYTTNWGADWSTGDFKANWKTPNDEGINFFTDNEVWKLFDWYNTEITDTVSVDSLGNATVETFPLNWPYIVWNSSNVTTENNIVHVLVKAMGASTESDFLYFATDEKVIAGFYDIVGEITETGVKWIRATYIAAFMGIDNGDTEWQYSNTHDLGIGYAGNGTVYATWIDRPQTRYLLNPNPDPGKQWICDSYFTYSPDDGRTWEIDNIVVADGMDLIYAANITKTNALQDEGFQVATHGTNVAGTLTVFAGCQYYDIDNPIVDPPDWDYASYQQFMKAWKIVGTPTGIEMEEVSMVKDFDLYQNYPNPFNPATEIKFALQNDSDVKLSVFNIKGEMVADLKNEKMAKGVHAVNFDASSLNSGVYFYKLEVGERAETKKMVLTK